MAVAVHLGSVVIAVVVLVVVVVLLFARGRHKRVAARSDALLVSRDDRTGWFARRPGRLRGNGGL